MVKSVPKTYVNELMHVIVEIFLHCSVCCFQAQNVFVASFNRFQSALQIFNVLLKNISPAVIMAFSK